MRNIKLIIQYEGTRYNGWQRQKNTTNTIQERFENVLFEMNNKQQVEIVASGRTDAGVHAENQTANFKCTTDLTCDEIKDYLNHYLPQDILVKSVEDADERFHSRLNAVSKTYEYRIALEKPNVFMRKYIYFPEKVPDVEKMRSAALLFVGKHDFKGFSSVRRSKKSTERTINSLEVTEESGILIIRINATGFLYNMVRIICGTLYDIGTGKLSETVIPKVFETTNREYAGITLPACGLVLRNVYYR